MGIRTIESCEEFLFEHFGSNIRRADGSPYLWHLAIPDSKHGGQHMARLVWGPDESWWYETQNPGHERDNITGRQSSDKELLERALKAFLAPKPKAPFKKATEEVARERIGALQEWAGKEHQNAKDYAGHSIGVPDRASHRLQRDAGQDPRARARQDPSRRESVR
jgi:hypothetical protein